MGRQKLPQVNPYADLRAAAKARIRQGSKEAPNSAETDPRELIHELEVSRVELELQNEELRRTQLALEESRDRYQDLYDHAPVGYLTLDSRSVILEANLTSAMMLGEDRGALLKAPFARCVAEEDRRRWGQFYARVMRGQGPTGCELTLGSPRGQRISARLDCLRSRDGDSGPGLRIALSDITERKRADERRQHAETGMAHMERLMLAGELATSLAHEVNQPLAAIANNAEACLYSLQAGRHDEAKLIELLERISAQARWAGDIVQRLRAFIRKRRVQQTACNVNALIDETLELLAVEARERGVSMYRRTVGSIPEVRADRVLIQQVIVNLLRNSLDALGAAPGARREIVLEVRRAEAESVRVTVRDSGPGVPEWIRRSLFLPFVTSKQDGLGVGLAISHRIVEAHDGSLWLGEPGGGGAVHFTLPVARSQRR